MSINPFSRELISYDGQFKFLGTMAGNQVSKESNCATYSRQYSGFTGTDEFRDKFFNAMWGKDLKKLGDHYSFTPYRLRDGRNFGTLRTTFQGGGFFLTLKKLNEDKNVSSLMYVMQILGPQFESISNFTADDLYKQFVGYGADYMIKYFFDPVDLPQDGDLVIYKKTDNSPHFGIFRESKANWNSPHGGTVESKWDWMDNSYIFQHDIFCVPSSFSNEAKFYRIKSEPVNIDTLAMKPHTANGKEHPLSSNSIYSIQDDGSLTFNTIKENIERRKIVDKYSENILTSKLPEIKYLSHIKFNGYCHEYAFGRILSTYSSPIMPHCQLYGEEVLEKYFIVTSSPQKGDLVVYYDKETIRHWGIYLENEMVESKWGTEPVYRHPLFDASSRYGNIIRCFRLKDGLTISSLAESLKHDAANLKYTKY